VQGAEKLYGPWYCQLSVPEGIQLSVTTIWSGTPPPLLHICRVKDIIWLPVMPVDGFADFDIVKAGGAIGVSVGVGVYVRVRVGDMVLVPTGPPQLGVGIAASQFLTWVPWQVVGLKLQSAISLGVAPVLKLQPIAV
jgi:hypothetical protein